MSSRATGVRDARNCSVLSSRRGSLSLVSYTIELEDLPPCLFGGLTAVAVSIDVAEPGFEIGGINDGVVAEALFEKLLGVAGCPLAGAGFPRALPVGVIEASFEIEGAVLIAAAVTEALFPEGVAGAVDAVVLVDEVLAGLPGDAVA